MVMGDMVDEVDVAVVGMGCRFPGGAVDPESFWRLLHDGVERVVSLTNAVDPAADVFDPPKLLPHIPPSPADIAALKGTALKPYRRRMQIIYQDPYESLDPRYRVRDTVAEPS